MEHTAGAQGSPDIAAGGSLMPCLAESSFGKEKTGVWTP